MLTDLFQIDDRVVLHVSKEARKWVDYPPNGREGVVMGFYNTEIPSPFSCGYRKPGIYCNRGIPLIRWLDTNTCEYSSYIVLADETIYNERLEKARKVADDTKSIISEVANPSVWFCELPDLPFMEGDTVYVEDSWMDNGDNPYREEFSGEITRIDYYAAHTKRVRSDGSEWPYYDVKRPMGGTSSYNTYNLTLVKRGNLYHYYKGDKSKITFTDLKDEVAFNSMIGKCEQLRNPATGLYKWTLEEVLAAIEKGTVDTMRHGSIMPGLPEPSLSAYRLDDRDLAGRVRAETLKGFKE